jgi:hypothetical protein
VQLNVDATRMSQAFSGSGYIQQIVLGEVQRLRAALPRRQHRCRWTGLRIASTPT